MMLNGISMVLKPKERDSFSLNGVLSDVYWILMGYYSSTIGRWGAATLWYTLTWQPGEWLIYNFTKHGDFPVCYLGLPETNVQRPMLILCFFGAPF